MSLIGTIVTEEEATPANPSGSAPLIGQVVTEFEEEKIKVMDDFINKNKSKFNYEDLKFSSKLKK